VEARRDVFSLNFGLLALYLTLLGLGVVVFYGSGVSAGSYLSGLMLKKLGHVALAVAIFVVAAAIPHLWYQKAGVGFMLASVALLVLLFVPGLGVEHNNAVRWLRLGPIEIQPSELVKVFLTIYLADFVSRKREGLRQFSTVLTNLGLGAVVFGLLMLEPDLGSAIIFVMVLGAMLFLGNARLVHLAWVALAGVLMGAIFLVSSAERWRRVKCFVYPAECPAGESYHLDHAQWAFGSGGAYGIGLGKGLQTNQGFVLKPQSDFVFAVIGEELGFVGTLGVVLCFTLLFLLSVAIAQRSPDEFGRYLALGLGVLLTLHAVIHMGVTMRLLPTKGLCLPLLSAGGSALFAHSFACGVLLSVSRAGRRAVREGQGSEKARASVWNRLKGEKP
jgi:cell division protein FtsW